MNRQDRKRSHLSPAGSRVSHLVSPGSEEARMMTATSGRKCLESYENSGQLGLLVKMCLESSLWHSTRCLLTWKEKVTPCNALLFRLAASMPRTKESDVLLWPTPSTGASLCGGTGNFKTLQKMAEKGLITEEERRNLSQGNGGSTNPELMEWLMGYEKKFTELIPTPTATDYKGGVLNRFWMPCSQIGQVEREREREQIPGQPSGVRGNHAPWENWPPEPELDRVVDGIPNRVDRLKCLGNAVVPQQFFPFFKAIADIETGGCS